MRKKLIFASTLALATVFLGGLGVAQQSKTTTTVTGEIVDLNCYMDHGAHGAGHKACGIQCAKAGNPVGLVTAKGKVYLLLAGDKHEPSKTVDMLIEKMSETATVTGKASKRGGIESISVESVK